MSKFTRCDCCGAECVSKTLHAYTSIVDWDEENNNFEYENIDCCPECTKKLQNFIYVLRNYPNSYVIQINGEGDSNAV